MNLCTLLLLLNNSIDDKIICDLLFCRCTMTKLLKLIKTVPEQYSESKISFWAYIIFNILTFATLIYSLVIGEYINCFYCLLAFFFLCLPPAFERVHNAYLPPLFEVVIMIFIFSFAILGESFSFMTRIHWWDTMLHTFYGFVFAALSFSLIEILNDDSELKFKLSPGYICLSTIGITTLFGVLWEFFEFFADHLLGKDMQKDFIVKSFQSTFLDPSDSMHPFAVSNIKSTIINYADGQTLTINGYLDIGITDTIKDLAVAFIGSFVFCIFLLAYLKTKGKNKFAAMLIPVKRNWNEKPPAPSDKLAKQIADLENQLVVLRAQEKEKETIEFRKEKKAQKAERESAKQEKKDNMKE